MTSTRLWRPALAALVLQGLALTALAPAQVSQTSPQALPIEIIGQDVERTQAPSGIDNTLVTGGQFGHDDEACRPGPQAFVEKTRQSDGARVWLLTGTADCDGIGNWLWAGMTSLDPAFIVFGTVYDLVVDQEGYIYVTGQILVAWESGGTAGAESTWGAFVLRLSPAGDLTSDAYYGAQPVGAPVNVSNCSALCATLSSTPMEQYGGRALALGEVAPDRQDLFVTGWKRLADSATVGDRDVFVARLNSADLSDVKWLFHHPYLGEDVGLDVVLFAGGEVFVTGYYGLAHDVMAFRLDGKTGALTPYVFVAGGPWDDEGREVTEGAEGVELRGCFTESAQFGSLVLEGEGPTAFVAQLTTTLDLISAVAAGPCEDAAGAAPAEAGSPQQSSLLLSEGRPRLLSASLPTPPGEAGGGMTFAPSSVKFVVGTPGSCACSEGAGGEACVSEAPGPPAQTKIRASPVNPAGPGDSQCGTCVGQAASSDDCSLHVYSEGDLIVMDLAYHLQDEASLPETIRLEFSSGYCTAVTASLGGGLADPGTFHEVGLYDLCPLDEPILNFAVPLRIAELLGFSAEGPLPEDPLVVRVELELTGELPCPPDVACAGDGKAANVDVILVDADF